MAMMFGYEYPAGRFATLAEDIAGGVTSVWKRNSVCLSIAFFCIALHPEAQKRAQAELDRVMGTDRLPIFEDRWVLYTKKYSGGAEHLGNSRSRPDGTLNGDTVDYALGFGGRICPGRAFAETEGTDGVEIEIDLNALTGGVSARKHLLA
ncbi:hypothetical protein AX14_014288 [Amanita brunnescens Koide BX004]|nr:hypothetical protein AX14_014288 [Amanita brunnescens Koide BX004]